MKRKTLLLILLIAAANNLLQAQIKKGSTWLGGQIGFRTTREKPVFTVHERTQADFGISPAIGMAIKDNLVLGLDAMYTRGRDKTESSDVFTSKTRVFDAGIFIRKYLAIIDRLYLFGQGRLGATFSKSTNNPYSGAYYYTKGFNIGIGFYPGISFAVNKMVHLESGINNLAFVGFTRERKEESTSTSYGITKSNHFGIGNSLENRAEFTIGVRVLLAN